LTGQATTQRGMRHAQYLRCDAQCGGVELWACAWASAMKLLDSALVRLTSGFEPILRSKFLQAFLCFPSLTLSTEMAKKGSTVSGWVIKIPKSWMRTEEIEPVRKHLGWTSPLLRENSRVVTSMAPVTSASCGRESHSQSLLSWCWFWRRMGICRRTQS
jgi:hypothetical protein